MPFSGVVVCLEDVTPLERERDALNKTLAQLEYSREEIRKQNEELRILATLDPLTACLNRRSFFEQFEMHWKTSQRYNHPISCVMIDLDHFKNVNDKWGHSMGDEVLRGIAMHPAKNNARMRCDLPLRRRGVLRFIAARGYRKCIFGGRTLPQGGDAH